MSPLREGCLGRGSPSPLTLFVELGLMISLQATDIVPPLIEGTRSVVPTRAWKEKREEMVSVCLKFVSWFFSFLPVCFVFERARAPMHFLLDKPQGQPLSKL